MNRFLSWLYPRQHSVKQLSAINAILNSSVLVSCLLELWTPTTYLLYYIIAAVRYVTAELETELMYIHCRNVWLFYSFYLEAVSEVMYYYLCDKLFLSEEGKTCVSPWILFLLYLFFLYIFKFEIEAIISNISRTHHSVLAIKTLIAITLMWK